MHRADAGISRSRLLLLVLPLIAAVGCTHLVAETGDSQTILPAKTPQQPTEESPGEGNAKKIDGGKILGSKYPPVLLSTFHAQWCTRQVGDKLPELELAQLGGRKTKLTALMGAQATVVIYWQEDRWMSQMALEDVQRVIVDTYDAEQVAVVGVPVKVSTSKVRRRLKQAKADFPQLLDSRGTALAEVGSVALPRIYVLDPTGTIVWFDIEYCEGSRRELQRTLAVLSGKVE